MAPSSPDNSPTPFRWFARVDQAYEAMLGAIEAARHDIRFEMYIFSEGTIGDRFRAALVAAARRGVSVRVLIDALGSLTLSHHYWAELIEAGGEARWFNPLQLRRMAIRNHRKLLVCDDHVAFVGGFNVADEYSGDGIHSGWFDLGLELTGVLPRALASTFERVYALADFQHHRFSRLRRARLAQAIDTADGDVLTAAPGWGRSEIRARLLRCLKRAQSVQVMAAYFLPTLALRRALIRVVQRGGRVQLLLAAKSDVPLSQWASQRFYEGLLRAGVEIYEYQPQILHAKLFIADNVVFTGSANLDRRSLYINYELLLRITREHEVAEARRIFAQALESCSRVDSDAWARGRTFWRRWKERGAFWILARLDPYIARRQFARLLALH